MFDPLMESITAIKRNKFSYFQMPNKKRNIMKILVHTKKKWNNRRTRHNKNWFHFGVLSFSFNYSERDYEDVFAKTGVFFLLYFSCFSTLHTHLHRNIAKKINYSHIDSRFLLRGWGIIISGYVFLFDIN